MKLTLQYFVSNLYSNKLVKTGKSSKYQDLKKNYEVFFPAKNKTNVIYT